MLYNTYWTISKQVIMTQGTNLAETILNQSSELFREQGYAATSIKQIARASGCTTAALYYYYEGGKSQILREVIQSYRKQGPDMAGMGESQSLSEFVTDLTESLSVAFPQIADQTGWLLLQFPNLSGEEKAEIQSGILGIHESLKRVIVQFTKDEGEAEKIAWVLYTMFYGYHQIFFRAEISQVVDLDLDDYGKYVAELFVG